MPVLRLEMSIEPEAIAIRCLDCGYEISWKRHDPMSLMLAAGQQVLHLEQCKAQQIRRGIIDWSRD